MSIDFGRMQAVFLDAVEHHAPEEWDAYLDQACAGDEELRAQVAMLLKAHAQGGSLPGRAALGLDRSVALPPVAEGPGTVIGPYKLLEQIGEGGFGVVFMAEQTQPVRRKVALKVLKPGMDTRQVVARFEAERQVLAILDHPHIAKVHDGGATPLGRPYFVMELVKGVPITDFCDQHQFTPRQRLELFLSVCQAVQHAHHKGIIHRDLKPSNILVVMHDTTPVVKVIDFGVAKALGQELTDKTLFTGFAQMVGTPLYMSPEQAGQSGLDIDTRSDIYSLGVLLYELLTGTTPFTREHFRQAAYDEIRRIIRETEPPRPSTRLSESKDTLRSISAQRQTEPAKLTKLVRGELDWIVMKCLEKDRNRRFQTANGLARDIERHLADEPVEACPPSVAYRVKKLLRRHRGPVVAAAVVLLALLAGIVGTTWGLLRAERERQAAEDAAAAERQARVDAQEKKAEADRQKARAAAGEKLAGERLAQLEAEQLQTRAQQARAEANAAKALEQKRIADAVRDFLQTKLLRQADPQNQATALLRSGGFAAAAKPDVTVRALLDRAAAELSPEKIEARFPKQPLLQAEILRSVGVTYLGVGEYGQAIGFLQRAAGLRQQQLGPDHPDTLLVHAELGVAYREADKLPQAIALLQETAEASKTRLGADHAETLVILGNLARAYHLAGKLPEAVKLFEQVSAAQERTLGLDHPATLTTLNNLGLAYLAAGELTQAARVLEQVRALREARSGRDHPETLTALNNLAVTYYTAGKYADALKVFDQVRASLEAQLGPDHPNTLIAAGNVAVTYLGSGRLAEALKLFQQVSAAQEARLGADHPDTLRTRQNLARAYREAGRLSEAIKLFLQVSAAQETRLGPDHPDTLTTLNNLALTYLEAGKFDDAGRVQEAIKLYQRVCAARERTLGPEHPDTLAALSNLAAAYRDSGRPLEALKRFEPVYAAQKKKLGPNHPQTLTTLNGLATTYWSAGQLEKSVPLFEELLQRWQASVGREDYQTLNAMINLGINYRDAGRLDEAIPLLEEAYQKGQTDSRLASWVARELVVAYAKAGKIEDAAQVTREQLPRVRKQWPPDSPQLANALAVLGKWLLDLKQYADAEKVLRECLTLREKLAAAPAPDATGTPAVQPWQVASARSLVGGALLGQEKYADAEPLLLAAVQGLLGDEKAIPARARSNIADAIVRLIALYSATGRPGEAAKWRQELKALQR
jgi:serine/threonine protein kinase/tetratricopeptide (TPR) repeat protein